MKWPEPIQSCDTTDHKNVTIILERTNNHQSRTQNEGIVSPSEAAYAQQRSKEIGKTIQNKILPKSQYQEVLRIKSCIDETGQLTQSQTGNDFYCPTKWLTTVHTDVISCYFREATTHTHQPSSNLADVPDCKLQLQKRLLFRLTKRDCSSVSSRPIVQKIRTSWNIEWNTASCLIFSFLH